MSSESLFFPVAIVRQIVSSIEDAVGDDIKLDLQRNKLRTRNSVPSRIWDYVFTNLDDRLDVQDCLIASAHRGLWEMLIVYERTSQYIITLMREKRFANLQKHQNKRDKMHYLDILAKQFNSNLDPECHQESFIAHEFSDEDQIAGLVQALLSDFKEGASVVRNHILVLFETNGAHLISVRAVKVTPDLNVALDCNQNWSKFISAHESDIVEKVSNPDAPVNTPTRSLKLKQKATERKKNKPRIKKEETKEKSV